MAIRNWVRKLFDRKPRTIRKALVGHRPRLEALEDRTLLSNPATTAELITAIQNANVPFTTTTITLAANTTFDFTAPNGYDIFAGVCALPQIMGNITIVGSGDTIERTGTTPFRLFDVEPLGSLTLENLTLQGGLAQGGDPFTIDGADGGAIFSFGTLNLSNVTVQGNRAVGSHGPKATQNDINAGTGASAYGGGVFVASGSVTLTNDSLNDNQALGGTGGDAIKGNGTGGTGGSAFGGGLYVAGGTITMAGDTLSGNIAQGGKGGNGGYKTLYAFPGYGGNGGDGLGGGTYVAGGTVTLTNDTLNSNTAQGGAGHVGADGTAFGEGFYAGAGGNGKGGGTYVAGGAVTLGTDTLTNNNATGGNGGTGGKGPDSSPGGGHGGKGGAGSGGGVYVDGGSGGGGPVAVSTLTLTNDTLSSNTATGGKGGNGGSGGRGPSDVGGNGANGGDAHGGGLYIASGNIVLTNTLIQDAVTAGTPGAGGSGEVTGFPGYAGSASSPDVSGTVASSDHDLIGDGTGSNLSSGDPGGDLVGYTAAQLFLSALANDGGPTQTIALNSPSPAIDAGDSHAPGLPSTDQRGRGRIVGGAVDIGAYEFGAFSFATDLSVSGNAPAAVPAGGLLTYTLSVTNGLNGQSDVTLTDQLPANTTLVSWTAPNGWSSSAPAVGSSSGTVSAWAPSLAGNASATFTLVVQVSSNLAADTLISTTASVGPLTDDSNPSNNSVTLNAPVYDPHPSNVSQLIADIQVANASSSGFSITLPANTTFDFTAPSDWTNGANALPAIRGNITIVGNGDTIERDPSATTAFRLFDVYPGGSLTLEDLTLTGGLAQGSGFAADGGAIISSGTLSLNGVTVGVNRAQGSNGGNGGSSSAGGRGASAFGGGLYVYTGSVSLNNDTFSGNIAHGGNGGQGGNGVIDTPGGRGGRGGDGGAGLGGGLLVAGGTVTLLNDTFSGNHALGGNGGNGGTCPWGGTGGNGGNGGSGLGGGLYLAHGSTTLTNTLIAENTVTGGTGGTAGAAARAAANGGPGSATAPDVSGIVASSDHDLIGDGTGSNLTNGSNGDQVGTTSNPINPLLSQLGNYGGATQTMALLPGSPAIDAGDSSASGLPSTDQRGFTRVSGAAVDVGAYETQGFTLSIVGGTNQSAPIGSAFAGPLYVEVSAYDFIDPVIGGQITFTGPGSGAGATLSNPATIVAFPPFVPWDGLAAVGATANLIAGSYNVTATTAGAVNSVTFSLTNNPAAPTLTVTDGGTYNGKPFPATGTAVGVSGQAVAGNFSYTYYVGTDTSGTSLGTTPPTTAGTYTVVANFTSSDPNYIGGTAQTTFTISPDPTSISVSASSATPVYGQGVTLTATVTTPPGGLVPTSSDGTVTFYDGGTMLGSSQVLSGSPATASLTNVILTAGQHAITASYSGDNNFVASQSGVEPTSNQVVVLPHGIAGLHPSASDGQGDFFLALPFPDEVLESKADGSQTTVGSGLVFPIGVKVDGQGDVFIDDLGLNHEVEVLAGLPVTVSQATPTVSVSDAGGTYNGNSFAATDSVAGVVAGVDSTPAGTLEGVTPTLTYYAGTYTLATLPASGGSSTAPTAVGNYTVVSSFAGSTDYSSSQALATFSIGQATPTVSVSDASGPYNQNPFAATATVAGVNGISGTSLEGVTPTLKYYKSSTASGTALTGAPTLPGTYTVQASFAGSADYSSASATTTFTINTPTTSITGPTIGVPGQPLTYTFTVNGPTQGIVFTINYGDGTTVTTSAGGPSITLDHLYHTTSTFTIQVTAKDQSGVVSQQATQSVKISTVAMESDPSGGTTLAVGGNAAGGDTILVTAANTSGTAVSVTINKIALGTFTPTGHILVYGQGSKETITLQPYVVGKTSYYIEVPALLYGEGSGGDHISAAGSAANNVLTGHGSNEVLTGGHGRDLLIGGTGAATLNAGSGDDILIGGSTNYDIGSNSGMTYDQQLAALDAIMAEWGSAASYATRLGALAGQLNSSTVHDNSASGMAVADQLLGNANANDWFFAGVNDAVKGKSKNAQVTSIT
jgi:uncharacterized repeat protein (TIGR01451 family)